jgi:doubled CXXCH motif protein
MKTTKLLVIGLVAGAALIARPATAALDPRGVPGIANSRHDFTANTNYWIVDATNTWVQFNNLCGVCHTIHHANDDRLAPLWVHTSTIQSFTPYTSPTLNASTANPGASSRACLSCHDGSVAINSIDGVVVGGTEVKIPTTSSAAIGANGDLTTTHPLGFTYDDALVTADGYLQPPNSTVVFGSGGKTINDFMLLGGKMECATCHDIHRQKGNSMNSGVYTKVGGTGSRPSELCLTCHKK